MHAGIFVTRSLGKTMDVTDSSDFNSRLFILTQKDD